MKTLRIQLSDAAALDVLEQSDWYAMQADESLAERWESAVTSTLLEIVERPHSGTPCRFGAKQLSDVRRTPIEGFTKHLVFYKVESAAVLILRIVHGARDLENLF